MLENAIQNLIDCSIQIQYINRSKKIHITQYILQSIFIHISAGMEILLIVNELQCFNCKLSVESEFIFWLFQ